MNELESLKAECLACRRCAIGGCSIGGKLSNVFSNMVFPARVMIVGQNPGLDEVKQGVPFVGASGRFLMRELDIRCRIATSSVYVSNVLKCLTPDNRRPTLQEMDNCQDFLNKEIGIVRPKLIVALGGVAMERLTGMHGVTKHQGEVLFSPRYKTPVLVLFHPSPLNMNDSVKKAAFDSGIAKLKEFVHG